MAIQRIRESEEMYLETILLLRDKRPSVRAVDVSEELGFAKSSVSRDLFRLTAARDKSSSPKREKQRPKPSSSVTGF